MKTVVDRTHAALRLRAHRILTDGLRHSTQAKRWARSMIGEEESYRLLAQAVEAERWSFRFSDRELSLGAQREW